VRPARRWHVRCEMACRCTAGRAWHGGLHVIGRARTRIGRHSSGGSLSARLYGQGRMCWGIRIVLGCRSLTGCCTSMRRLDQRLRTLVMRRAVCAKGHLQMNQQLCLALQHPRPLPLEEEHDMAPRHRCLLLYPPLMMTPKMMTTQCNSVRPLPRFTQVHLQPPLHVAQAC